MASAGKEGGERPDPDREGSKGWAAVEEEEPALDPIPRFEATRKNGKVGRCPRCRGKGPVGKFCLECVDTEIGRCPECETEGPIREACWECARNQGESYYREYNEMGTCPHCDGEGIRYTKCLDCEDAGALYE